MDLKSRVPSTKAGRIVTIYAVGAAVWILVSDHWIDELVWDIDALVVLQSIKGLLFVALTSLLLYGALVLERRRVQTLERERFQDLERLRLLSQHVGDVVYRYRVMDPPGFEYLSPSVTEMTGYTPEDHYADPTLGAKLVHEDDLHLVQGQLEDVSEEPVLLRWKHRDGHSIWAEQRNTPVRDESGRTIAVEGITRDVTGLMAVRERLASALREAERAEMYATRLQEVIATLVEARTKAEVIEQILDAGVEASGAESCVIGMVDPSGRALEIRGARQERSPSLEAFQSLPLDADALPTRVVREGEPAWLHDRDEAERFQTGLAATMEHFGSAAVACIPLKVEGKVLGAINLAFDEPQDFDAHTRTFLTALAQQCANAYARTVLRDDIVRSRRRLRALSMRMIEAQESERRRIARELHDEFGQLLGALKFNLHIAIDKHTQHGSSAPAELRDSVALLDELFTHVRSLSRELRPAILDDLGLSEALDWLCERFGERSSVDITVEHRGTADVTLPSVISTTAYRIVQECLNNVTRHAEATHATVTIDRDDDALRLEVRDDGRGFDVDRALERASAGSSLGLLSITERAELVGGRTEIHSGSDVQGTLVKVWLPLRDNRGTSAAP